MTSGRPPIHTPGTRYGKLQLLARHGVFGIFECECGNITELRLNNVIYQGRADCGCVKAATEAEQTKNYEQLRAKIATRHKE